MEKKMGTSTVYWGYIGIMGQHINYSSVAPGSKGSSYQKYWS